MEKRKGWGAEYADKIRNGEWEYQAFTAGQGVNAEREAHRLLRVPQAAAVGRGLRVLVRQAGGEVSAASW